MGGKGLGGYNAGEEEERKAGEDMKQGDWLTTVGGDNMSGRLGAIRRNGASFTRSLRSGRLCVSIGIYKTFIRSVDLFSIY